MLYEITIDDRQYAVDIDDSAVRITDTNSNETKEQKNAAEDTLPDFNFEDSIQEAAICSPMQGRVVRILAALGQRVKKDEVLAILESMKMEIKVSSDKNGIVKKVNAEAGMFVKKNDELFYIASEE